MPLGSGLDSRFSSLKPTSQRHTVFGMSSRLVILGCLGRSLDQATTLAKSESDRIHFCHVWVPKMPSKSFRPEFHQIDEFNFDSAFVNSDNSASHSLGQTNLRKIRPSFRDGLFGLFRRINLIAPSRFLRLDLSSISIREHN